MRLLFLILTALLPAFAAAEAPMIEWSPTRPLTWDDFQGDVPRLADPERVATSNTSLSWSYAYAVDWSREGCRFRILRMDAAAGFHPDSSWARPGHRTPDVLAHEQGHFDITELHYEAFVKATQELVGVSHKCSGNSERKAKRNAETEIARLAGTIYETIWREHLEEQKAYDDETRHGIDSQAQAEWTARIAARLGGD